MVRKVELGELCSWLWGNRVRGTKPVVKNFDSDLTQLERILSHEKAVTKLKEGCELAVAHAATKNRDEMLEESLEAARRSLVWAQALVRNKNSHSHRLRALSASVACMAQDLAAVIESNDESPRASRKKSHARVL